MIAFSADLFHEGGTDQAGSAWKPTTTSSWEGGPFRKVLAYTYRGDVPMSP